MNFAADADTSKNAKKKENKNASKEGLLRGCQKMTTI